MNKNLKKTKFLQGNTIRRLREWRFSGYSGLEDDYPVSNYAGKVLQCQDCHMKDPTEDTTTGKSIRLIYRFLPKGTLEFTAKNGYVISLDENDYESHKVEVTLTP